MTLSQIHRAALATTMHGLRALLDTQPIAFYEVVMSARDSSHVFFGESGEEAIRWGLLEGLNEDGTGRMHEVVREVITAAVTGEDFDMVLGDPR